MQALGSGPTLLLSDLEILKGLLGAAMVSLADSGLSHNICATTKFAALLIHVPFTSNGRPMHESQSKPRNK